MPIRNAKIEDKYEILKIAEECVPLLRASVLGTYEILARCFSNTFLVFEDRNTLIGYIVGFPNTAKPSEFWIYQIGVDESYRGQGIGSNLLSEMIKRVELEGYSVIYSHYQFGNEHSHNLHNKFGFKICGQDEIGNFIELIFSK